MTCSRAALSDEPAIARGPLSRTSRSSRAAFSAEPAIARGADFSRDPAAYSRGSRRVAGATYATYAVYAAFNHGTKSPKEITPPGAERNCF